MEVSENNERIDEFINYMLQLHNEGKLSLKFLKHLQLCIKKWKEGESLDFLYNIQLTESEESTKAQMLLEDDDNVVERDYICNGLQIHSNNEHFQVELDESQSQPKNSISQYDNSQDHSECSNTQDHIGYNTSQDQIHYDDNSQIFLQTMYVHD